MCKGCDITIKLEERSSIYSNSKFIELTYVCAIYVVDFKIDELRNRIRSERELSMTGVGFI